MIDLKYYLWLIVIIIYIISPRDLLTPSFIDDLIALLVVFYLTYKNRKKSQSAYKKDENQYSQRNQNEYREQKEENRQSNEHMTLHEAYKIFGVDSDASFDIIKRAYKEKIVKNHPDKVSHLSGELQEKARQLTVEINRAYELIKKERNIT